MFHRKVLLKFFQQDLEPLHSAWWRYKDLLMNFSHHGFQRSSSLRSSLKAYAGPQECGLKEVMVSSLSTKDPLMKPTIYWRTWLGMIIGLGLAQGESNVGETISTLWSNKWTPDYKIS